MRNSGWDDAGSGSSKRRSPWIKWLFFGALALVAIPATIGLAIGGLALSQRSGTWSAVRTVHTRLQTDEGARSLFRKNPRLAYAYADEEAFVGTVRAWRAKVGALPAREPGEGPDYELSFDPEGAGAQVKGQGGAWMWVDLHGGAFSDPKDGEGLVRLYFGEDRKALEQAEAEARDRRNERERAEFLTLLMRCSEDMSARELYRAEPGLKASYRDESAFLDQVRPLRPAIAALASDPKAMDGKFRHSRLDSPLGLTVVYAVGLEGDRELSATWKDGKLRRLELQGPGQVAGSR